MSIVWVCGVDEAGRGPLVGAVVAGAVVLDPNKPIDGLKDSKKLTAAKRDYLYEQILENAKAWGVGEASPAEIDQINILQATMLAMHRAIEDLSIRLGAWPGKALIDGNRCPELPIAAEAIIKGDAKEPAISAASIIAKVTRDRQMMRLHKQHPEYVDLQILVGTILGPSMALFFHQLCRRSQYYLEILLSLLSVNFLDIVGSVPYSQLPCQPEILHGCLLQFPSAWVHFSH